MTQDELVHHLQRLIATGWTTSLVATASGVPASDIEGLLARPMDSLPPTTLANLESWLLNPSSLADAFREDSTKHGNSSLSGIRSLYNSSELLSHLLELHIAVIESANEKAEDLDLEGACEELMEVGRTLARNSVEVIAAYRELMAEISEN